MSEVDDYERILTASNNDKSDHRRCHLLDADADCETLPNLVGEKADDGLLVQNIKAFWWQFREPSSLRRRHLDLDQNIRLSAVVAGP